MTQVLVIGLDGASWNLLQPWMKSNSLPNLAEICENGVYSDLRSCLPPVTSPNWKCYSTGKNPGKFGVYWWEIVDRSAENIRTPESTDFQSAELWDYLGDASRSSAVINMPTTFPPREIDGWLVSGGPGTDEDGYATPSRVEDLLEEKIGYTVHPEFKIDSNENVSDVAVEAHVRAIESRFEAAREALKQGDFDVVHVTTFYINVLQHFFWNGTPTYTAWEKIDEEIGKLMNEADTVVLMSDHGCNEISWEFRINRWLEKEGYLALGSRTEVKNLLGQLGVTRSRLRSLVDSLPYDIRGWLPQSVKNTVPSDDGTLRRTSKVNVIDWDNSSAIASGQGPIYVIDEGNRDQIKNELQEKLARVTDPEGSTVIRDVHSVEDIYEGPYLDLAPDLVIDQNEGYHLPGNVSGESVFSRPTRWAGENRRMGMFAAHGEDIASTGKLNHPLNITDLLPTILHLIGDDVPNDVDGRVRKEIFARDSEPSTREVTYRKPLDPPTDLGEVNELTEDHLRDLGYL